MKMYLVVLIDDGGDGDTTFWGVFDTREKAEIYIKEYIHPHHDHFKIKECEMNRGLSREQSKTCLDIWEAEDGGGYKTE